MTGHVPILLVDDNRGWRETLAELLHDQGFEVWAADGPRAGQLVLDERNVMVAIIDLHMPEMNGLEWLRQISTRLPVLVLSSEDDPAIVEQTLAEGALAFVSKNLAPRQLVRTLLGLLLFAVVAAVVRRRMDHLLPAPDDGPLAA